jgi:hypothetical protein
MEKSEEDLERERVDQERHERYEQLMFRLWFAVGCVMSFPLGYLIGMGMRWLQEHDLFI